MKKDRGYWSVSLYDYIGGIADLLDLYMNIWCIMVQQKLLNHSKAKCYRLEITVVNFLYSFFDFWSC